MDNKNNKPELLCPAGDMERLKVVLKYGADAVYLAGKSFGLRASAGNFTPEEMAEAKALCSSYGAKMYVTLNALPHEGQEEKLKQAILESAAAGADGYIIADLGVMDMAKRYAPDVPLHVSTQLGIVNSMTAKVLYSMGATRVVLAREMTMEEIKRFRDNIPPELEIEAFVHGAMCVSFSGRCLLSNYMTGRDANGGACAQPCRWKYHLVEEKRPGEFFEITEDDGTYIMNSSDMCMIEHIPELMDAGVSSLKIEGRMKSTYYAAITTYAYRGAIDDAVAGRPMDKLWLQECMKVSHRRYSTGFYFGQPGQYYDDNLYFSDADVCAVVKSCDAEGNALLSQRNKFCVGDRLELVVPGKKPVAFDAAGMRNKAGEEVESCPHACMDFTMKLPAEATEDSIIRKLKK